MESLEEHQSTEPLAPQPTSEVPLMAHQHTEEETLGLVIALVVADNRSIPHIHQRGLEPTRVLPIRLIHQATIRV